MSKTFVTSDTHFNHENIIKYCERPFVSIGHMNEAIIANWNKIISKDDIVYFLGDFTLGGYEKFCLIYKQLNGKIEFVPGNHDKKWIRQYEKSSDFEICSPNLLIIHEEIIKVQTSEGMFLLCHYPIENWKELYPNCNYHIHGHSHGSIPPAGGRYDIGIDVYGGPIELKLEYLNNPKGW